MNISTIKLTIAVLLAFTVTRLISCSKKNTPALATGSVYIQQALTMDTIGFRAPYDRDTIITMEFSAAIKGGRASSLHHVVFRVDTTRMADYKAQYGDSALLLPASVYFVDWSSCEIPADSTHSEPAQINIVHESSALAPSTTYVLPVVIDNVDGQLNIAQHGQVLYLLVRTSASLVIPKTGWSITSYSSQLAPLDATNLLDNSPSTDWASGYPGMMPQYVIIDMGQSYQLSKVRFTNDPAYEKVGGYATQINIQISQDGIAWTDKGMFTGTATTDPQLLDIGSTTARFINFTVVTAASYSGLSIVIIGDISAMQ